MLNQYCSHCGSPTSYISLPPKFCSACSEPFISQNQSPSPNVTLAKPKISKASQQVIILDDEELEEQIPQITSLAYEVKNKPSNRSIRISDLRGRPEDTGRIGKIDKKAKRPKIDKVAFMADVKASGRNNPIEIGE